MTGKFFNTQPEWFCRTGRASSETANDKESHRGLIKWSGWNRFHVSLAFFCCRCCDGNILDAAKDEGNH